MNAAETSKRGLGERVASSKRTRPWPGQISNGVACHRIRLRSLQKRADHCVSGSRPTVADRVSARDGRAIAVRENIQHRLAQRRRLLESRRSVEAEEDRQGRVRGGQMSLVAVRLVGVDLISKIFSGAIIVERRITLTDISRPGEALEVDIITADETWLTLAVPNTSVQFRLFRHSREAPYQESLGGPARPRPAPRSRRSMRHGIFIPFCRNLDRARERKREKGTRISVSQSHRDTVRAYKAHRRGQTHGLLGFVSAASIFALLLVAAGFGQDGALGAW